MKLIPDDTPHLNCNGIHLNPATLAWICDTLEREGRAYITGVGIQAHTPMVKELGFTVTHEDNFGNRISSVDRIKTEGIPA